MELSYILNSLGEERKKYFGAVTPPIIQSSNFCFETVSQMRHSLAHEMDMPFYTRGHNPTVAILRQKIAALEGAEEALILSSGSAAMANALISSVNAGDHVVSIQKPYSWTNKLLANLLSRFGISHTMVDGTDPQNYAAAIQPNTKAFVLESPNSMTFELQDIPAICEIAKTHQITTIIDNSYASPYNQQVLKMGADIVIHSASKYLNGHSDVVAGVICSSREICQKIFHSEFMTLGNIISPHDAWLMIRGLRTFEIRMDRVAESTPKIVSFLEAHPGVESVIYPHSPNHPQHELALKQMKRPCGQFSLLVKANEMEAVERFCNQLKHFVMACSWGGYESLIFPLCTLYDSNNYSESGLPWNMIRFYVGLEDPQMLIDDLNQAFEAM